MAGRDPRPPVRQRGAEFLTCPEMRPTILAAAALAQEEPAATASPLTSILFPVLLFAAFYFLLIRPQRTRARRQQEMQSEVGVGDHIETIGGIRGRVVDASDDTLVVEIESGRMRVARRAVGRRITG